MNENSRIEVEEVSEARPVPKAPPLRAMIEREPDYLEGFLNEAPREETASESSGDSLVDEIVSALRQIYDPEIPVNIYDLGLIYNVEVDGGHANVTMTLTTPHCPVAETMPGEVEMRVTSVPGVASADIHLVWDPPWDPGRMSDEAKLEMGML
ncbi:MAG: SUF system Fe-S cluster assembly protein [Polymorphobacter sp.]|uniref:SUF system Fe-S cluster assembly protein n=1 Tax=Polymorphobacter sp. TaxID=1909290 RepID=UPI003A8BE853